MFLVRLHSHSGEIKEYRTNTLQYAKRYADLYKDEFVFTEIIFLEGGAERVIETFTAKA